MRRSSFLVPVITGLCLVALAGCTHSVSDPAAGPYGTETVTLLTHDSFVVDKSLIAQFKKDTGLTLAVQTVGDAGQLVSSAILASGAPAGDVLFGVDNTLAPKAVAAKVFAPYSSTNLSLVGGAGDTYGGVLTPVDFGDVCVVADNAWFSQHHVAQPATLADLAKPTYKNLLVVEDPALSSPGTAFLDATVARYGSGWQQYWTQLRANGVKVASSWTQAYEGDFSAGGGKGTRPLVVSYGTDAAADLVYASNPKPKRPGVSVMHDGCYRQVEYAGVLRGTTHIAAARAVIDWLTSVQVQQGIPLSMFVYPARTDGTLPEVFKLWAPQAPHPLQLPTSQIAASQTQYLSDWGSVMGR